MKKIYLIFVLLLGVCFTSIGQNLNSYKYVVVTEKFEFLKESNEYQMNALTKFLFEKYGFTAFMESELKPADLSLEPCNTLYADVIENSGFLKTNLQISLKNCNNQVVFTSEEGSSREKDFKMAYQGALRDAFKYIAAINYIYDEKSVLPKKEISEAPVEVKSESVKEVKENKVEEVIVSAIPGEIQKNPKPSGKLKNKRLFVSDNLEVYLLGSEYGFQIFQKEMEEPFAKLIKTNSAAHFIYSTLQNTGIAFFVATGNLIVEILAENGNNTSIKTYKLKN